MAPVDEAQAYARMRDRGLSQRQIAGLVHKSAAHVNARLQLLAEPDIATAVRAGALPPTAARAVLRARKGRQRAASDAVKSMHTPDTSSARARREAETEDTNHAEGERRPADDRPHHASDEDLVDLAESRTAVLLRQGGWVHVEDARAALAADLRWLSTLFPERAILAPIQASNTCR